MNSPSSLTQFACQLRGVIQQRGAVANSQESDFPGFLSGSFNTLALQLFQLQFSQQEIYRRLCQARGMTPETLGDWKKIPAVAAAAFKDFEFSSIPPEQRRRVFCSSGTTGQRSSRSFHHEESLELYEASLMPWFVAHLGTGPKERLPSQYFFLTPSPARAPHSSLVHMFETVRARLAPASEFFGLSNSPAGWELDFERIEAALHSCVRPVALLGTAFNFVHLIDRWRECGQVIALPAGSRVMETGGYKGRSRDLPRPQLHRLISECLGIPTTHIVGEYGMSELSSQAYDTSVPGSEEDRSATKRIYRFPPWARVQVISPESGEPVEDGSIGLLRITDLANVWSLLAVQTEDLGIRRGDGFEWVGRSPSSEARGCSLLSL